MNSAQNTHGHDQQRVEGEQATRIAGEGDRGRSGSGLSHDPKTITRLAHIPNTNHS